MGNLDTHDGMCRDVCEGCKSVVVSVEYRLAPEHPFPAGVEDAVAATIWVNNHAWELGGSETVGIAGDGAGGNLAAVVTQQLRRRGIQLAGQFLIYPVVDHVGARYFSHRKNARGYHLEARTLTWFYDHYARNWKSKRDPRLAPMQAVSFAGLPPAVIVTAEYDPLRDEAEAYGRALQAAGGRVEVIRCQGMIHGFFAMGRWSPAAYDFVQNSIRHFGRVLRDGRPI